MPGEWNEAEFASLFREHYVRVLGVARRVVGSKTVAEEVSAEAFWRLYQAGPQTASTGSVYGWLYRTATRAAIDALRAIQRRPQDQMPAGLDPEDRREDPLAGVLRREEIAEVRSVLARLDVEKAQMLLLRHDGVSYAEIAELMGVRPSSVGTMLARAEDAFCKLYRQQISTNERTPSLMVAKEER